MSAFHDQPSRPLSSKAVGWVFPRWFEYFVRAFQRSHRKRKIRFSNDPRKTNSKVKFRPFHRVLSAITDTNCNCLTLLPLPTPLIEHPEPVSRKSRRLFGPVKPLIKLRLAYSVKLVFSYVVKGIKI